MLRIALVNMPFSAVEFPSIALTQLQSVLRRRFGARVAVEVCYPSHDCSRRLGLPLYRWVCDQASHSGLGDWLFRQLAFPALADNTDEYRQRYFPAHNRERERFELVRQLDRAALLAEIVDTYGLLAADLVGFTSMFTQNVASFALARRLKAERPAIATAMGGANCESPMGEQIARHVAAIDYVFSGPALVSFPHLVTALLDGDPARAEGIDGLFTHANSRPGAAARVAPLGAELPIDEPVELDYAPFLDAFESTFGGQAIEPVLMFETSRGCWWGERAHCTFCGLNGSTMKFRSMAPAGAAALLHSLFAYHPRARHLSCVDNIMPKEYPRALFAGLATPPGVSIFYEVKADLTDEELAILSRAAVDFVQPGIEALASSTLALMRKGTTAARNVRFLTSCLLHDIHPGWNLLIGFPGEGEEVFRRYLEDIPRLTHLPPPSGVHPVRFDRFSPYFTQHEKYGLALAPLDFYRLIYPHDDAGLRDLAYYFADRNSAAPYFIAAARWIGRLRKAVAAWRDAWVAGRPPVLHLTDGDRVLDTRSGRPVVHQLAPLGRQLLLALSRPTDRAELAAAVAAATPPDEPAPSAAEIDAQLAGLAAAGLLFEDRQRLISLVLPHAVDPRRVISRYLAPAAGAAEAAA